MSVALHGNIETPQLVTCERVGPTLKDNHRRLKHFNRTGNDLRITIVSADDAVLHVACLPAHIYF